VPPEASEISRGLAHDHQPAGVDHVTQFVEIFRLAPSKRIVVRQRERGRLVLQAVVQRKVEMRGMDLQDIG
jgi:hypothetical protein